MLRRRPVWRTNTIIIIGLVCLSTLSYGQLIINEVCTSNGSTLEDLDGEFKDWIELYNGSPDIINMDNYRLSDKGDSLGKWSFPAWEMAPGQHLAIFASGKDRKEIPLWWHTIIREGDDWNYTLPDASTPTSWRSPDFDDSQWNTGASGFGYGDNDDATVTAATTSLFLRKQFDLDDISEISGLLFHIDFDDGFVAYINGIEIARSGLTGTEPAYNTLAYTGREASMYSGGSPVRYEPEITDGLLRNGQNVIAIQVHNISSTSSDLTAIPFLSILKSQKAAGPNPEILQLIDMRFHTSFKLDADGESLYLSSPGLEIIDSVHIGAMNTDHSLGRELSAPAEWVIYTLPTPGSSNITESYKGYVEELPLFSIPGGRFSSPFQLSLNTSNPSDKIYYTLDGSVPGSQSPVYESALDITSGTVVRARIIRTGLVPGDVISNTYYTGTDNHLPVVSISTDPENLWNHYTGIYVPGPNADENFPYFNANFWQDWEKPAHISLFDEEGSMVVDMDCGIKIYGGWTRGHPQKSMAIFARNVYRTKKIEYRLFEDKSIDAFEGFVLRNSGNDWFGEGSESGTMFRDILMTRLSWGMDIEHQAFRQAILYLNGEYWGIHNIREKINEHFLASNRGVDPDELELLESWGHPIQGDPAHYESMISFAESNNIELKENFDYLSSQMDMQNFINYQVAQIYYDNRDWPGNNIKFWRPATPRGKWRWILYDTDFGFGMWNSNKVYDNTFLFATEPDGPGHPNPPWSTLLLRKLIANKEFRTLFINTFADRINTNFHNDSVSALVDELKINIDQEMFEHSERWGGSYESWDYQARKLKDFGRLRPGIMHNHIIDTYGLVNTQNLTLEVSDPSQGYIKLNSIFVEKFPWEGIYFQGNPIELIAIPKSGYRFMGWSGGLESDESGISLDLETATTLIAHFEPNQVSPGNPVIINEICYIQDAASDSEDWVELFNHSDQHMDISGWVLKDSEDLHAFQMAPGTLLKPRDFLVICRNTGAFETVYPTVPGYQGSMDFGLSSKGDNIRLFNRELELVDSVAYTNADPWPQIPAGSGLTLELIDPDMDNSLAASWELSESRLGTPGGNNAPALNNKLHPISSPEDILFQNSPNPFSVSTRIVFYSGCYQPVRITVYDLNGRLVKVLANRKMEAGYHELEWTPEEAESGFYILRVKTPGSVYTRKMVLQR